MEASAAARWSVFTNHGHVLIYVASNPDARVRDIAASVGITERATQTILRDLQDSEYIEATRVGRRNHYRVLRDTPLHHPAEHGTTAGAILDAVKIAYGRGGEGSTAGHLVF